MATMLDPIEVGKGVISTSTKNKIAAKAKAAVKKPVTTMTGEPVDKIIIDPNTDPKSVAEAATVQQRVHRAVVMKRFRAKINRGKQIAKKRFAGKKQLNRRSLKKAKDILRKRVAGQRGANYAKLSRQEKVAVDKMLDKKKSLIKKISSRIYTKVKQNELKRMSSVASGKPVQRNKIPIVAHLDMSFKDRVSLHEKSIKSNVSFETILEVFNRGVSDWEDTLPTTKQQHAFARVNSYLAKGKAFEMDSDLHSKE